MYKLFIISGMVALCGCSNHKTSDAVSRSSDSVASGQTVHAHAADTIVTGSRPIALAGCYEMVFKKDTATLQLQVNDSTVKGQLDYYLWEKDRNTGQLNGVLRNDLIVADYTFQSEGVISVQEVVFKIKDDTLLQGFGDLVEEKGKVVFKNKEELLFQPDHPFIKVSCP